MKKNKIKLIPWREAITDLIKKKGDGFVKTYLSDAFADGNPNVFNRVLGNVIRARPGGIKAIAKKSGVGVRTIYRMARGEGAITEKNRNRILKALGFALKVSIVKLKNKKVA